MARIIKLALTLLCLVGGLLAFALLIDPHTIEDWRFANRHRTYYQQVTRACDELIVRSGGERCEVPYREVNSLPSVLRDLNPEYVIVETNFVMLRIGGGLMSKRIIWGVPTGEGLHLWKLSVSAGDSRPDDARLLYKEHRSAPLINRLK